MAMSFEYEVFSRKREGENTYLQVAVIGNPNSIKEYGYGEYITDDYVKNYDILCQSNPEDVLDLWRNFAYESDVAENISDDKKFIVDKDSDSVYLMIRIDEESDIVKYQQGNW